MGGSQSHATTNRGNLQILQDLEKIIFDLNENNIDQLVESSLNYISLEFQYSILHIIYRIIYSYFVSRGYEKLCFKYLQTIETKSSYNIINIFTQLLLSTDSQESNYLLEKMIEDEIIEPKIIQTYFMHYFPEKENINKQIEELKENDFELHKKLIEEGHNPNEIAKIIRNDETEKLQEISSQTNFDFNQTIEPSPSERCSFVNKENVTLIDYAAFFSAVKCFKYLLMNGAKVENTGKYAVAGGNEEIIHLCEQNHSSFEDAYETAIEFHQNDIFIYLYNKTNMDTNDLIKLGIKCIKYNNYEIFSFLEKEGMEINDNIIQQVSENGNTLLINDFIHVHNIPKNIILFAYKSRNIETVKLLLEQKGIDINAKDIIIVLLNISSNNFIYILFI